MPKCPEGKIVNPKTGRCVKKDGVIGKKILGVTKKAKTPVRKTKTSSKTPKSPKTPVRKTKTSSKKAKVYEEVHVVVYKVDYGGNDGFVISNDVNYQKLANKLKKVDATRLIGQSGTSGFQTIFKVPKENITEFKKIIRQHYNSLKLEHKPKIAFPTKKMLSENSYGKGVSIDEYLSF